MSINPYSQLGAKTVLLLLFYIEDDLYAIDTSHVIEIVPVVLLRKIKNVPEHVAGVFNYHRSIVPVIDLCQFIRGTPCRVCYSTRLIMVNYWTGSGQDKQAERHQRPLGLLAERVTETLKVSVDVLDNAERGNGFSGMGELFTDERGLIQKVNWEQILPDNLDSTVLAEGSGWADAGRN